MAVVAHLLYRRPSGGSRWLAGNGVSGVPVQYAGPMEAASLLGRRACLSNDQHSAGRVPNGWRHAPRPAACRVVGDPHILADDWSSAARCGRSWRLHAAGRPFMATNTGPLAGVECQMESRPEDSVRQLKDSRRQPGGPRSCEPRGVPPAPPRAPARAHQPITIVAALLTVAPAGLACGSSTSPCRWNGWPSTLVAAGTVQLHAAVPPAATSATIASLLV